MDTTFARWHPQKTTRWSAFWTHAATEWWETCPSRPATPWTTITYSQPSMVSHSSVKRFGTKFVLYVCLSFCVSVSDFLWKYITILIWNDMTCHNTLVLFRAFFVPVGKTVPKLDLIRKHLMIEGQIEKDCLVRILNEVTDIYRKSSSLKTFIRKFPLKAFASVRFFRNQFGS